MLSDRKFTVMLPAKDTDRAIRWYDEKLGMKAINIEDYGATYRLNGGTPMFLYKSDFAGSSKATLLSVDTDDLAGDMQRLRGMGVKFEDYDLPDMKTVDGVADFGGIKNAWFKDSEGNIIGLVEGMM
jgi:catechol 2,3-dioxygenase-like lactoylglutathione lyase family enzyme